MNMPNGVRSLGSTAGATSSEAGAVPDARAAAAGAPGGGGAVTSDPSAAPDGATAVAVGTATCGTAAAGAGTAGAAVESAGAARRPAGRARLAAPAARTQRANRKLWSKQEGQQREISAFHFHAVNSRLAIRTDLDSIRRTLVLRCIRERSNTRTGHRRRATLQRQNPVATPSEMDESRTGYSFHRRLLQRDCCVLTSFPSPP